MTGMRVGVKVVELSKLLSLVNISLYYGLLKIKEPQEVFTVA